MVKMGLGWPALVLLMLAETISGTAQCSNRFYDGDQDQDQDDGDDDDEEEDDAKLDSQGATLVQLDGVVRGERTARLELFRGVLTGQGELQNN